MKTSLENRTHIENLVTVFYEKVKLDPTIGFIFTEKVQLNWPHHIGIITDFWESILLDNPVYKKNAMEVHYDLNKKIPLEKIHFETWLQLFFSTIDELFEGPLTEKAKIRAKAIADLMSFNMHKVNKIAHHYNATTLDHTAI